MTHQTRIAAMVEFIEQMDTQDYQCEAHQNAIDALTAFKLSFTDEYGDAIPTQPLMGDADLFKEQREMVA